MSLHVLRPGLLTTVQDVGRSGYQRYGIVAGGAADPFAARVANLLVGNDHQAAVLEMAFAGPQLRFDCETLVAWCGGDFVATLDGKPLEKNRPVRVPAGSTVEFGPARKGTMAWLAIAGGIAVPPVMGSRSTYLAARIGGLEGRSLAVGDSLPLGASSPWAEKMLALLGPAGSPAWSVHPERLGRPPLPYTLRVMRGPEWEWFTGEAQQAFFNHPYTITKDSNRMGTRLAGDLLPLVAPREMVSAAVNQGVIQVPPSGQPILLGADRQTIGGYPRIGVITTVDFGSSIQLRPGDSIRFQEISTAEAHILLRERELDFNTAACHLSTPRP